MSIQIIHSEEDAKFGKICPILAPDPNGIPTSCQGSMCMAWRWVKTHIHDPDNPTDDLVESTDTHGYCGLAGDPR